MTPKVNDRYEKYPLVALNSSVISLPRQGEPPKRTQNSFLPHHIFLFFYDFRNKTSKNKNGTKSPFYCGMKNFFGRRIVFLTDFVYLDSLRFDTLYV
jgi:hypothetical protein